MNPGWDTVTFVSVTPASPGRLGVDATSETTVSNSVPGCSFQPLSVKDQISNTEYAEATHRCISPPTTVVLACKAEDELVFNGQSGRVMGVKTFWEHGRVHHVDVICKIEQG